MSLTTNSFDNYPDELKALATYGPYRAVIQRIVDGDTLVAEFSIGFQVYALHSIRLIGIDAPEINSGDAERRALGVAAKDFLESICGSGSPIIVTTEKDRRSFNRYVATVLFIHEDKICNLSEVMVESGHATKV